MPETLTKLQQQATEVWKNLNSSQKTRIFITSAILFVVITVGIFMLTRTNYVELGRVTDSRRAQDVERVLQEKGINYKPGHNGVILVDSRQQYDAEFALAASGVSEDMTFEDTWDKLKLTSTESDKRQLWQEYKKRSLISKLKMFDNVRDADVDLALPDNSLFFVQDSGNQATAYVRITPRGTITPEQVEGITRVVSASVEGLDPKNVTVVDNHFNILNSDMGDSIQNVTSSQHKLRLQVKSEMENNVKRLYAGRSQNFDYINVVANPVLNFDVEKQHISGVEAPAGMEEGAIVSREIIRENLVNESPGGQPGMDTNPGAAPGYPTGTGEGSSYDKSHIRENFLWTQTETSIERSVGTINYDDSSLTVTLWYGERVTDAENLSDDFIDSFRTGVSSATGVPAERIAINTLRIDPPEQITESVMVIVREIIDSYGYFILMLILVLGLVIALLGKKKENEDADLLSNNGVAAIKQMNINEEEVEEINLEEKSEFKKQINKFVKEKPDSVAQLLRNWLTEDWE